MRDLEQVKDVLATNEGNIGETKRNDVSTSVKSENGNYISSFRLNHEKTASWS